MTKQLQEYKLSLFEYFKNLLIYCVAISQNRPSSTPNFTWDIGADSRPPKNFSNGTCFGLHTVCIFPSAKYYLIPFAIVVSVYLALAKPKPVVSITQRIQRYFKTIQYTYYGQNLIVSIRSRGLFRIFEFILAYCSVKILSKLSIMCLYSKPIILIVALLSSSYRIKTVTQCKIT